MLAVNNRGLTLSIILLIFLGIILDQFGYITQIRSGMQLVLQPVQMLTAEMAGQTDDLFLRQQTLAQLQTDNDLLRQEINRLLIENIRLKELDRENRQLRELLNYTRNNPAVDYTAAGLVGRVIGSDPSNLLYTIIIDVGARDGIARDMPVINNRGVVGRVTQVGPTSAQVLLIVDPASSLNVVVQNSRIEGIVRGQLDGSLIMERIPQGVTVSPGDLVLTSGLGGKFPNKLVVGQVTEVIQQDLNLFQTGRVRGSVDFNDMDVVLVITTFEPVNFEQELIEGQESTN